MNCFDGGLEFIPHNRDVGGKFSERTQFVRGVCALRWYEYREEFMRRMNSRGTRMLKMGPRLSQCLGWAPLEAQDHSTSS